jgi:hypothetical protein
MTLKKYKSLDKFNIVGRGTVFIVECDIENAGDLHLQTVIIDDEKYFVRGVEKWQRNNDIGQLIGLQVRKIE